MNKESLDNLIQKTNEYLQSLASIEHEDVKNIYCEIGGTIKDFCNNGKALLSESETLQIGIVGQVKAGKSSFLNSLLFNGEDILPKASTPMTAGLTIMEYSDNNSFEIEYFTKEDWKTFEDREATYQRIVSEIQTKGSLPPSVLDEELKSRIDETTRSAHEMIQMCGSLAKAKIGAAVESKPFSDISDLQNCLEKYVGAKGTYTSVVKSLYVKLNDERLRGLRIVDTPGVNDPIVSREERTHEFLGACHGVFLLSYAGQFCSENDINFLNTRICMQGIRCVAVIASKFDTALTNRGFELKNKGQKADLGNEADELVRMFSKRLNTQIQSIPDYGNLDLKVDYSCGIGFAIARKIEQGIPLDSFENNVLTNMKRYFPDYFGTLEETKETFDGLSNIADIEEKYVRNWFLPEKDRIIGDKINSFFSQSVSSIRNKILSRVSFLENKIQQIESLTQQDIEEQRNAQRELFDGMNKIFRSSFDVYQNGMQNKFKTIRNNISTIGNVNIPESKTTECFEYEQLLWHSSDEFTYSIIPMDVLRGSLKKKLSESCDILGDKYTEFFSDQKNKLTDKLIDAISEREVQQRSKNFNADYYRELIDETLSQLTDLEVLDISALKNTLERSIDITFTSHGKPVLSRDSSKSELQAKLGDWFYGQKLQVERNLTTFNNEYYNEVVSFINSKLETLNSIIDTSKATFANEIKSKGEEYLNNLEEEIKKKNAGNERSKKQLGDAVTILYDIQKLFN